MRLAARSNDRGGGEIHRHRLRGRRVDRRVRAIPAVQIVRARAALQPVIAVPASHHVAASQPDHGVAAPAAAHVVRPGRARQIDRLEDEVVLGEPRSVREALKGQRSAVRSAAPCDPGVRPAAGPRDRCEGQVAERRPPAEPDLVVVRLVDRIVREIRDHVPVEVADALEHEIVPAVHRVRAVAVAGQRVRSGPAYKRVRAVAADQDVRPAPAVESGSAAHRRCARLADNHGGASQRVAVVRPDEARDLRQRVALGIAPGAGADVLPGGRIVGQRHPHASAGPRVARGIVPGPADDAVGPGPAGQCVVARSACQRVVPRAPVDQVAAPAAVDGIGRVAAGQRVVVIRADQVLDVRQRVARGMAAGRRPGGEAHRHARPVRPAIRARSLRGTRVGSRVGPFPAVQPVRSGPAVQHIVACAAEQHIVLRPAVERIVACAAVQAVGVGPAVQNVVVNAAEQRVVSFIAVQRIVARGAQRHIVSVQGVHLIVAPSPNEPLVETPHACQPAVQTSSYKINSVRSRQIHEPEGASPDKSVISVLQNDRSARPSDPDIVAGIRDTDFADEVADAIQGDYVLPNHEILDRILAVRRIELEHIPACASVQRVVSAVSIQPVVSGPAIQPIGRAVAAQRVPEPRAEQVFDPGQRVALRMAAQPCAANHHGHGAAA